MLITTAQIQDVQVEVQTEFGPMLIDLSDLVKSYLGDDLPEAQFPKLIDIPSMLKTQAD